MEDLRLAVRALRANPMVSLVAVLSLALGIGANTAIFSLVNGLLLRALPVAEPERLVTISSDQAIALGFKAGLGWNYPMWDQLQQRSQPFDGALAWSAQRFNLAANGEAQPVEGLVTSGNFFTVLGVNAALGRTFTAADEARGGGPNGPVVVISDGFWKRRFGAAANVIGTPLALEGVPLTIVGVTPPGFLGLVAGQAFDVALPLGTEPLVRQRALIDSPESFVLFVMLRLKPGQPIGAATETLRALQPQMHGPIRMPRFARDPFTLVSAATGTDIPGTVRQRYQRPLLAIFMVVALVLLIACGNIANLLLARASARRHELSVRVALGAPRWRLARQLLVESLVLAGIGACGGLAFAAWGSRALVAQLSSAVSPVALDLSIDWRVFGFTAVVTLGTVVLFGTLPAARAARVAPIDAMKAHGRASSSGAGRGLSGGLVVVQVALSLVLVVAAGLFVRTFGRLATMPLGFDRDRVLVVTVDASRAHAEPAARLPFYHRLVAAVASVPGVEHAAGSTSTPVSAGLPRGVKVPGTSPTSGSESLALWTEVTPRWFATYGTTIRDGRDFDERDTSGGQPVAIVNEAFARRFFAGRRAIGETVSNRTIVGVTDDQVMQGGFKLDGTARSLRDGAPPAIYIPLTQTPEPGPSGRASVIVSVRWAVSEAQAAPGVAAALRAVDPDLAFTLRPLADQIDAGLAQERMVAWLSGFFGALALLLVGLGLYGVTAYAVARQRAEIGIRLALGAPAGAVVRLVLSRVTRLVALGIGAGALVSIWISTFVATLLYGIEPRDPVTLAGAAVILVIVGATAGWLPAHRASRIDPLEVLRSN
jgi:putative ABC transport system permease protein